MVSSLKTFDVSKSGKMAELTKTKHRFGILVEFAYKIAYRMGFENSTGNTKYYSYSITVIMLNMIKPISYGSRKIFY